MEIKPVGDPSSLSDTQLPRFQVFCKQAAPPGRGSVHAPDSGLALLNAEVFVRRPECSGLWVIPGYFHALAVSADNQ
jgi:1,2-phenylacetyl-CoA epoxidase PaaB subunit